MGTVVPLIALAVIAFVLFVAWPRKPKQPMPADEPERPMTGEEIVRANGLILRDQLSHAPFGELLARRLWHRLQAGAPGVRRTGHG